MPVTTNRGYSVPATGSDVDIWGSNDLNPNFAAIDTNIGGVTNIALTNANVTLSSAQYACGTIRLTGILTSNVQVIFPAVQGWWTIDNQTTGAFAAILTIGSGQVIAVEQGTAADIFIDGTNVKFRNLPQVGSYLDVCDATVPLWITSCTVPPYLNCNGGTFSAVTYPYLNTKLGGTTLPDLRGTHRATLNQGTNRITTAGSAINGDVRFSIGGAQNVTLVTSQLASHTHANVLVDFGHTHNYIEPTFIFSAAQGPFAVYGQGNATTGGNNSTPMGINNATAGSDQAHNNMPPTTIAGITLIRAA